MAQVAMAIAAVLFVAVLVSFRPFSPAGVDLQAGGGDIVNQLGYGSLGALATFGLVTLADPRRVSALLSPWWLLLLCFLILSALNTADPAAALRAASFTLIGMMTVAAILVLPRDADSLSHVFVVGAAVVLVLCFAGVFLYPSEAIHSADTMEPEHAGFWRGLFTHKNVAGPVMACLSFIGIYLMRRSWWLSGLAIFVFAMIFLANTGSKTTAGLVPLAILVVVVPGMTGMRRLTSIFFFCAVIITAMATLGIVFLDPLKELAQSLAPDLTYTGRTALWEFGGEMIARRPWFGYGYENFWGTRLVTEYDQYFDQIWDFRGVVHGHDGYIDLAIAMGLPALAVALWTFLVEPARDYMKIPLLKENIWLGDLFMMIALFTTLNAFLESFFFRRVDPVWVFFVFAMLGLRLVARFPVKSSFAA